MKAWLTFNFAVKDLLRRPFQTLMAVFGLTVGSWTLVFFLSLIVGVRGGVINTLFPLNVIEVVSTSGLFGSGDIGPQVVKQIKKIPHVSAVYPKKKAQFQAILEGRLPLVNYDLHLEAFFDGIDSKAVLEDVRPKNADFKYHGEVIPCKRDNDCARGRCIKGFCFNDCRECSGKCVDGRCVSTCSKDSDCFKGWVCQDGGCVPLRCKRMPGNKSRVTGLLFGRGKHPERCPVGTYCATFNMATPDGVCEAPIPVVLSPLLTQLYNSVASSAFHLPTLKDLSILTGLKFTMVFGASYFVADEPPSKRVLKQARIAGFSSKAIDLGVTMPLQYVEDANARYRGKKEAKKATSIIVEADSNDAVPLIVKALGRMGLVPSTKYQASKRMADVLYILSIVFGVIAGIVFLVSAGSIAQLLMLIVAEKSRELAILRAVGATRGMLRVLVLAQGVVLGLAGGIFGVVLAYPAAVVVDRVVKHYIAVVPGMPQTLFSFNWWILAGAIGASVVAALIGAYGPGERAVRVDPTRVLSSGG